MNGPEPTLLSTSAREPSPDMKTTVGGNSVVSPTVVISCDHCQAAVPSFSGVSKFSLNPEKVEKQLLI